MKPACRARKGNGGFVLILTLLVLTLITAMVTEFAYNVYVNIAFLENYQASQRLSLASKSGVTLAARFITDVVGKLSYTYPGYVEMPASNPFSDDSDGGDRVALRIEDENARFNLNSVVYPNGELNKDAYEMFKRLLERLDLDEEIADRLADWIDKDDLPRVADSENDAKNAPLDSVDEILLLPGMNGGGYAKLLAYVTIYGSGLININSAELPVIASLDESISDEMAGRIISRRELTPFERTGDIVKVPGFEKNLGIELTKRITVKAEAFRVISAAAPGDGPDGIKKTIECVLDGMGGVRYWKEI